MKSIDKSDTFAPIAINPAALHRLGQTLKQANYRFTTVSPATHCRVNARYLNDWAESPTEIFGWNRPFKSGAKTADLLDMMQDAGIALAHGEGWRSALRISTIDSHLFFHSAYPTDQADAVFFGPDTYRFIRALHAAIPAPGKSVRRAADIGCGAGPGALAIALACPEAQVWALDINDTALALTQVNAALADVSTIVTRNSDLLTSVQGHFDLIVANPPYLLDPQQRLYRHGGGNLGTGLSLGILDIALERLAPGGTLLLYTGVAIVNGVDGFLSDVTSRLENVSVTWRYEEIDPDIFGEELEKEAYAQADRIAAILLKVTKN